VDTLSVLKDLQKIDVVGSKQRVGDLFSRLICESVATCIHRHDRCEDIGYFFNSSKMQNAAGLQDVLGKRC